MYDLDLDHLVSQLDIQECEVFLVSTLYIQACIKDIEIKRFSPVFLRNHSKEYQRITAVVFGVGGRDGCCKWLLQALLVRSVVPCIVALA